MRGYINTTAILSQTIKAKKLSFEDLLKVLNFYLPRRKAISIEKEQSSNFIVDILEKTKELGFKSSTAFFGTIKTKKVKPSTQISFWTSKQKNYFNYSSINLKEHNFNYMSNKLGYMDKKNVEFNDVIEFLSGNINENLIPYKKEEIK